MPELLLELFSEEIPARMQARAAADLERLVNERLLAAGFLPEGVKAFATPRRLALVATGLPARQPDRREEKKGPRVGAPEKAIEGFLKSAGLASLDQCEKREDKKGAYWVALVEERGRPTAEVAAEFVPEIVRAFPWPKSMRWGDGELRWVRPLKSILCCFDGETVTFEIEGVVSGDATEGHRFMAPGTIRARSFEKYEAALRRAKVVLSGEERAATILAEAKTLCAAQGLELVEDQGLLAEVAGLAEWPVPMMGRFDEKFLAVPDEALTASMRGHQKYFSVRDPKTGRLANRFVFVANLEAPDGGAAMRAGYERVLTARLSDAYYLYRQDLKTPLEDRVADLDRITFFEGLGSVGDKARRVADLAKEIAPDIRINGVGADPALAERAARLAKADLTTAMVREFPELQGVMGRYYALAQGLPPSFEARPDGRAPQDEERSGGASAASRERGPHPEAPAKRASKDEAPGASRASKDEARSAGLASKDLQAIADAIRDHYKPQGADDDVPTAPVSVAVALADRIDTLTAFWSIGKKPTGSSDPFALRRAALGVIRKSVAGSIRFSLKPAFLEQFSVLITPNSYDLALQLQDMEQGLRDVPVSDALELVSSRPWRFVFEHAGLLDQLKLENPDAGPIDILIDPDIVGTEKFFEIWSRTKGVASELINFTWGRALTKFSPSLKEFVLSSSDQSHSASGTQISDAIDLIATDLLAFFHDRLKVYLRERGHRHDHVDAVLNRADGTPEDDLVLIVQKLEALAAFLKTDDGANLAAGYKRAANILKAEEKKGPAREGALNDQRATAGAVNPAILQLAEEKSLFAALEAAEKKAKDAVAAEKFEAAMAALASLRAPIDAFFDKVTVNADDPGLRANRLALLARLRAATAEVADLSKLEG